MRLLHLVSIILLILPSFSALSHNSVQHNEKLKVISVAENIFMLRGQGGNIGVIVDNDKAILIDSQYSSTTDEVVEAVKSITSQPIRLLINTHYHSDHTGGNANFAEKGVSIISHENTRKQLASSRDRDTNPRLPEYTAQLLPSITISDNLSIYANNEEIEVIHFPNAHTDGDLAIFLKTSNAILTGDLYFVGVTPFIDVKNGGTYQGYLAAMQAILKRADKNTKIVPGHGPLANKSMMLEDFERISEFDHTSIYDN